MSCCEELDVKTAPRLLGCNHVNMTTDSAGAAGPPDKLIGFRLSQADARRLRIQCATDEETQQKALETLTLAWMEGLVNLHELRAELQRRSETSAGSKK